MPKLYVTPLRRTVTASTATQMSQPRVSALTALPTARAVAVNFRTPSVIDGDDTASHIAVLARPRPYIRLCYNTIRRKCLADKFTDN